MHERPPLHKRMRFFLPMIGQFRLVYKDLFISLLTSTKAAPEKLLCLIMNNLNIHADHDRCVDWCKEHNMHFTPSVKCPRAGCSDTLGWTRRASSREAHHNDTIPPIILIRPQRLIKGFPCDTLYTFRDPPSWCAQERNEILIHQSNLNELQQHFYKGSNHRRTPKLKNR